MVRVWGYPPFRIVTPPWTSCSHREGRECRSSIAIRGALRATSRPRRMRVRPLSSTMAPSVRMITNGTPSISSCRRKTIRIRCQFRSSRALIPLPLLPVAKTPQSCRRRRGRSINLHQRPSIRGNLSVSHLQARTMTRPPTGNIRLRGRHPQVHRM